jgi:aromatic ring-cleaving dioxygenase
MADHDVYPLWLGQKLDLDVEFLRRFAQGEVSA